MAGIKSDQMVTVDMTGQGLPPSAAAEAAFASDDIWVSDRSFLFFTIDLSKQKGMVKVLYTCNAPR